MFHSIPKPNLLNHTTSNWFPGIARNALGLDESNNVDNICIVDGDEKGYFTQGWACGDGCDYLCVGDHRMYRHRWEKKCKGTKLKVTVFVKGLEEAEKITRKRLRYVRMNNPEWEMIGRWIWWTAFTRNTSPPAKTDSQRREK